MVQVLETTARSRRRFVRHYVEMVAAMVVGMMVLGGLVQLVCALTGHEDLLEHAGTSSPIMAANMTIGMGLWMRHRGHAWSRTAEMAGAMNAPMVVLLVPFWFGALPGGVLLGATHVLMLPAMWLAMLYRRQDYTHH